LARALCFVSSGRLALVIALVILRGDGVHRRRSR
jgi:hypothetical protein